MARSYYLTARCPSGCETWLPPRSMSTHLLRGCRGHPWIDNLTDEAVVRPPLTDLVAALVPGELLRRSGSPSALEHARDRQHHPRPPAAALRANEAVLVRSPVGGVRPRRWLQVVGAAVAIGGPDSVAHAVTPDGFHALSGEVCADAWLVECRHCGETLFRSGLDLHLERSVACRWRRASAEVRERWAAGWRDPWSAPDVPDDWDTLRRTAAWRSRLWVVRFPRWAAVLVAPNAVENVQRAATTEGGGEITCAA